jgi:hypothetical protein
LGAAAGGGCGVSSTSRRSPDEQVAVEPDAHGRDVVVVERGRVQAAGAPLAGERRPRRLGRDPAVVGGPRVVEEVVERLPDRATSTKPDGRRPMSEDGFQW